MVEFGEVLTESQLQALERRKRRRGQNLHTYLIENQIPVSLVYI